MHIELRNGQNDNLPSNPPLLQVQCLLSYWRTFVAMGHTKWPSIVETPLTTYPKNVAISTPDMNDFFHYVEYDHPLFQRFVENGSLNDLGATTDCKITYTGSEAAIARFEAKKASRIQNGKQSVQRESPSSRMYSTSGCDRKQRWPWFIYVGGQVINRGCVP
ncbi:hypothetical protein BT63DRAFT_411108 [Microthyrium microscopicum]|uniref:Uncharacterized protein n=1 Tax=Microthyrium microscopicum TaxID=703497 RepID=A0A6A6UHK9_9PEZI|nr:hypothetical protein BT63DRAFT_411108 [Microthyrium microscopicum]